MLAQLSPAVPGNDADFGYEFKWDGNRATRDGTLRHPSFKGLRDDKKPQDVVREGV